MINMKPSCIVVDDEPISRNIIEGYIAQTEFLNHVKSFSSAASAIDFLTAKWVDILFIDIEMPYISGIDMVRSIRQKPLVVFTTAHPEYAVESFELKVCDYLLKPISYPRFLHAAAHCLEILKQQESEKSFNSSYLIAKQDKIFHKIKLTDILFIENIGDYVRIYTEKDFFIDKQTMKALIDKLPEAHFIRVHKSYIVSFDKVNSLTGNILNIGKHKIPVGESFRSLVKEMMK